MSSRSPRPSRVTIPDAPSPYPLVLDFLADRFPQIPRDTWHRRIEDGLVTDDEGHPVALDTPCRARLRLSYFREVTAEPPVDDDVRILCRDDHLLVACKPHGMPVTPGGRFVNACLLARVRDIAGTADIAPLHRLDRDTAGLVLFSVDASSRGPYHRLFALGRVAKRYEALCRAPDGPWTDDRVIESRIEPDPTLWFRSREATGPVNARTRVHLLERRGEWARFALEPLTGKRHQLRLHMAAIGAPILHDRLYPKVRTRPDDDDSHPPLLLLARALDFSDPITGAARHFISPRNLDWPSS
jgi:tRNA pseudouridine32 synthase/23S rRNA pseudouridine746 synthase